MKYSLENQRVVCNGDYWIADSAVVVGSVVLGHNASVWFNCVIRGDHDSITIGENSQIQDGCILHVDPGHPMTIGANVSVGHMAMLHGCTIGDGTLIGIKAVILNDAVIGKNCLIGAGTLIAERKQIPDGSLVVGSPGKVLRQLREDEIRLIHANAEDYVRNWKRYKAALKPEGS
jgi:carbonic anhydrase/acetyltransferase-like protein (isoleucine patch superfamily)